MPVLGMRHTGNLDSLERPKAWRQGIYDEYPDAAPLVHLIYRVGKEKVSDPEFWWYERRTPTRELTLAAAFNPGSNTGTITVAAGDAYNVAQHSLLFHPATGDYAIVTSTPTSNNQISIAKIGSGNFGSWANGSVVQVFSNAYPEGATVGAAITITPDKFYNYCQIFRNVADVTRTLSKTLLRTGDKAKDAQKNALLLHELDKEGAFIFGRRSEDLTATPGPRRTTGGVLERITTNVVDFTSGISMSALNAFLAQVFTYGSDEKILFAGRDLMLRLEDLARLYTIQFADVGKQDSFGITLTKWKTSFGTLFIKEHKMLSRSSVYRNWGIILDPDTLIYRYVDDTEWYPNRQNPGDDRIIGEYLAEVGLEFRQEYTAGVIKNCGPVV